MQRSPCKSCIQLQAQRDPSADLFGALKSFAPFGVRAAPASLPRRPTPARFQTAWAVKQWIRGTRPPDKVARKGTKKTASQSQATPTSQKSFATAQSLAVQVPPCVRSLCLDSDVQQTLFHTEMTPPSLHKFLTAVCFCIHMAASKTEGAQSARRVHAHWHRNTVKSRAFFSSQDRHVLRIIKT